MWIVSLDPLIIHETTAPFRDRNWVHYGMLVSGMCFQFNSVGPIVNGGFR